MKSDIDHSEGSVDTGFRIDDMHVHEEQFLFASPRLQRMMDRSSDPLRYQDVRGNGPHGMGPIYSAMDFAVLMSDALCLSVIDCGERGNIEAIAALWINPITFHERSGFYGKSGINILAAVREDHAGKNLSKDLIAMGLMMFGMVNQKLNENWLVNLSVRSTNAPGIRLAHTVTRSNPKMETLSIEQGQVNFFNFRVPLSGVHERLRLLAESE